MKPIQIGLLVVVGAIGGALVMKVTQPPAVPVATAETPAAPAGVPAPAPAALPAEAPVVVEPKPSPVEPQKPMRPKVAVVKKAPVKPATPASIPEPPKETAAATPPPAPTPAPDPPLRPEPEVVTPAPSRPEPPPPPHTVRLNAGMLVPVRLVDGLSSERNVPGDAFTATLDKALVVDGFVIAERGARVDGRVVSAERAGKVKGVSSLGVEITRLRTSDGQTIALQTESFERRGRETHTQDAAKVGGGAALGAIIGAIAGGGKGAAIGAAAGGGAGAGGVLLTRGEDVRLTSETRIDFRLRAPVTVTERR